MDQVTWGHLHMVRDELRGLRERVTILEHTIKRMDKRLAEVGSKAESALDWATPAELRD